MAKWIAMVFEHIREVLAGELATLIGAEDVRRAVRDQGFFQGRHAGLAFAPDTAGLALSGVSVREFERIQELPRGVGTGVGHEVILAPPRLGGIPEIRAKGFAASIASLASCGRTWRDDASPGKVFVGVIRALDRWCGAVLYR